LCFRLFLCKIFAILMLLKSDAEVQACAPLLVTYSQTIIAAHCCEAIDSRKASHLVSPYLLYYGATSCDDALWKTVLQFSLDVVNGNRRRAIHNIRWQHRYVNQPTLAWHKVITITRTNSYVCQLEVHILVLAVHLSVLSLT